jgi:hypothetical protein
MIVLDVVLVGLLHFSASPIAGMQFCG